MRESVCVCERVCVSDGSGCVRGVEMRERVGECVGERRESVCVCVCVLWVYERVCVCVCVCVVCVCVRV